MHNRIKMSLRAEVLSVCKKKTKEKNILHKNFQLIFFILKKGNV